MQASSALIAKASAVASWQTQPHTTKETVVERKNMKTKINMEKIQVETRKRKHVSATTLDQLDHSFWFTSLDVAP